MITTKNRFVRLKIIKTQIEQPITMLIVKGPIIIYQLGGGGVMKTNLHQNGVKISFIIPYGGGGVTDMISISISGFKMHCLGGGGLRPPDTFFMLLITFTWPLLYISAYPYSTNTCTHMLVR